MIYYLIVLSKLKHELYYLTLMIKKYKDNYYQNDINKLQNKICNDLIDLENFKINNVIDTYVPLYKKRIANLRDLCFYEKEINDIESAINARIDLNENIINSKYFYDAMHNPNYQKNGWEGWQVQRYGGYVDKDHPNTCRLEATARRLLICLEKKIEFSIKRKYIK